MGWRGALSEKPGDGPRWRLHPLMGSSVGPRFGAGRRGRGGRLELGGAGAACRVVSLRNRGDEVYFLPRDPLLPAGAPDRGLAWPDRMKHK